MTRPARTLLAAISTAIAATVVLAACDSPSTDSSSTDSSSADSQAKQENQEGSSAKEAFPDADVALQIRSRRECPTPGDLDGSPTKVAINNTSSTPVNVFASHDGEAFQVIERIGPSASRLWDLQLPDGTYELNCVFQGKTAVASDTFTVSGSSVSDEQAQKMKPVTNEMMTKATLAHSEDVARRLPDWVSLDDALLAAVRSGDRESAKKAWKAAYLKYQEFADSASEWPDPAGDIGPFGPVATPNAEAAHDLTGYHRLEWGLWHDEPMDKLADVAKDNNDAIHEVTENLDGFAIFNPNYGLRTHEVTEELERNELLGATDYGAHVTGGAVSSSIVSTRSTLKPLRTMLDERGLDLEELDAQLDRTDELAKKMSTKYDGKVAFDKWEKADRDVLSAQVVSLDELLAPVATMTVVRRME